MKRISILCSLLVLAFGASAQQNQQSNYIGIVGGGGLNTLLYQTVKGETSMGFGYTAELRYAHFFGKHFGIGIGAQLMQSSASTLYDFTDVTTGLTHDDNGNLTYDLRTTYTDWREVQTLRHLGVPVELYWRAPMGDRWAFLLGLGARFDLPLDGQYSAKEGAYDNAGQFYVGGVPLSYTIEDLPEHGFRAYHADFESDLKLSKWGVSVIADLGFNCAFSNHWNLYLGIYGGYGLTNLLDSVSTQPVLTINATNASQLDYNGTLASNQTSDLRLLNAGVKIGIGFGWNCHKGTPAPDEEPALVATEPAPQEPATKPEPKAAPANQYGNNSSADEEAAAREARCNARRMNNPDLALAVANIEADLNEASQAANEANSEAARNAVLDARATTSDAMQAHKKGQYCKSYDLFNGVYGDIANCYAATAASYAAANGSEQAKKAADDAALYAEAAHKDGLDCAMAASRNAKLNSDIARGNDAAATPAYSDPAFASRMADEALALSTETASKPATTAARDASGKAYRGNLAESYAASALSFARSAKAIAEKKGSSEARTAADEAERYASEAAEAARMGNTAAAYRAARAAQQAALRAKNGTAAAPAPAPAAKPSNEKQLAPVQSYIDRLNSSVRYGFGGVTPEMNAQSEEALTALAQYLKSDRSLKILITGHTDNVGTPEGNLAIGKSRANALKQLLVKHGAPAASIKTASKGQTEPVADNDTDEHRAQNRRAVISLQ